jgi:hypothetical protein
MNGINDTKNPIDLYLYASVPSVLKAFDLPGFARESGSPRGVESG